MRNVQSVTESSRVANYGFERLPDERAKIGLTFRPEGDNGQGPQSREAFITGSVTGDGPELSDA